MTLRLRFFPDPILKTTSARLVTPPDPKFLAELYSFMKHRGGVGLSAIQVGVAERIVVLDIGKGPEFYLNPKVLIPEGKKMEEVFGKRIPVSEGCLSFPGIIEKIYRYPVWTIEYLDEKFEKQVRTAEGLRAHVLQHEGEHLDGRLFVDELRSARRGAILSQMMKLRRQGGLR